MRPAAFVFLLLPTGLLAQLPDSLGVRGWLVDAGSALPIPRAHVILIRGGDTVARSQTDSMGVFTAKGRLGDRFTAHFRRMGYIADSIEFVVSELPLRVAMTSGVTMGSLASVTVRGSLGAFDRRARRSAGGQFVTQADIERRKPHVTSDLMRSIAGTRLADSLGIAQLFSQRAMRRRMSRTGVSPSTVAKESQVSAVERDTSRQPSMTNCAMRVRVNGQIMPSGFSLNDIRPSDIYGIEIYPSALTLPPEFQGVQVEQECGLIAIWLKIARERRK